jgi:hypothetical protein
LDTYLPENEGKFIKGMGQKISYIGWFNKEVKDVMAFYNTIFNLLGVRILKNSEGQLFLKLGSGKIRPIKSTS